MELYTEDECCWLYFEKQWVWNDRCYYSNYYFESFGPDQIHHIYPYPFYHGLDYLLLWMPKHLVLKKRNDAFPAHMVSSTLTFDTLKNKMQVVGCPGSDF